MRREVGVRIAGRDGKRMAVSIPGTRLPVAEPGTLFEAGITLPAENAAVEGADDVPEPEPVKVVAPAKKAEDGVQCISLTHALHIAKKDIVGAWDNGMSQVFNAKDRFRLKDAGLAEALEARGQIVVVK